jgi:glucose-6-phosphate 1-dehydrogenase
MTESNNLDELMACRIDQARKTPEPCTIVIFGASGDLTARKLIPALYHLYLGKPIAETHSHHRLRSPRKDRCCLA